MIAAELIAEIGVDGFESFVLQMSAAGDSVNNLSAICETAFKAIIAAAGAAAAAFVAFTTSAIAEATKVERIQAILRGIAGPQVGRELFAFTAEYSKQSLNTLDNLAAAQDRLEAGGLNSKHFIPIIDLLSALRGGGLQSMLQFTDAYVRIASGGSPALAMRAFRSVGIGANDLRAQGIEVTAANRILGDPGSIITAIDKIIQQKFGSMRATLKDTMAVAFVDLQDSWNLMLANFGKAWFPFLKSILEPVTSFVNFLADSGRITALGNAFANAFGALYGNAGGRNAIISFLSYILTAIAMMPRIIDVVGHSFLEVGRTLGDFFIKVLNNLTKAALEVINFFRGFVANVMDFWRTISGGALGNDPGLRELHNPITFTPFSGIGDLFGRAMDMLGGKGMMGLPGEFAANQRKMLADYDAYSKQPRKETEKSDALFNRLHQDGVEAEKETARNTATISAHMVDFKRYVLGGGDRARTGVTLSERYGTLGRSQVNIHVQTGSEHLDRYLTEVVGETVQSMRRGGW